MKLLSDYRDRIAQLAQEAQAPLPPYWLEHDRLGTSEAYYCEACAAKVMEWICGGDKPEEMSDELRYREHPSHWRPSKKEDVYICGGPCGMESDHHLFCELCGVRLDATLTDYAVEEEVSHFASLVHAYQAGEMDFEPFSPDTWWDILQIVDGSSIMLVEREGYENEDLQETCDDALRTIQALFELHDIEVDDA